MHFFKTIFFFLILIFISCTTIDENQSEEAKQEFPDQESWNSQTIISKRGIKKAIIHSGHLCKYNDKAYIEMDQAVKIDFFDEDGNSSSHLTALRAEIVDFQKESDFTATGNVIVISDSGAKLYTEELNWTNDTELITSNVFVKFVTEQDTLTGVGFQSDAALNNWIIHNPSGVTNREVEK